jgi:uncharacterized protein (TIGR02453 family)
MINPKLLTFLRAIKKNNTKAWYENHKIEYKALQLEFRQLLEHIRDEVVGFDTAVHNNHKNGIETVKVFRLYRDARFSKDKTKYKTAISGLISANVKDPLEPVYYFAIEPGGKSFVGGGVRTPERTHLDSIRKHIATDHKKLRKLLHAKTLHMYFPDGMSNEFKLKKAPQGYDVEHPAIDLLRYKNFTIGKNLTDSELKDEQITHSISKQFKALQDINTFLRVAGK